MEPKGRSGLLWLIAPLAICLPCLLPFIAGAALTVVGVGALASFVSDNVFWLAISSSLATLVLAASGRIILSRMARRRWDGARSVAAAHRYRSAVLLRRRKYG